MGFEFAFFPSVTGSQGLRTEVASYEQQLPCLSQGSGFHWALYKPDRVAHAWGPSNRELKVAGLKLRIFLTRHHVWCWSGILEAQYLKVGGRRDTLNRSPFSFFNSPWDLHMLDKASTSRLSPALVLLFCFTQVSLSDKGLSLKSLCSLGRAWVYNLTDKISLVAEITCL